MTRKNITKSPAFILIAGIVILLIIIFIFKSYHLPAAAMNIITGLILFYIILILLRSRSVSYALIRISVFLIIIAIPVTVIVTKKCTRHFKGAKTEVTESDAQTVPPSVTLAANPYNNTPFERSFTRKFHDALNSLKQLENLPGDSEKSFNKQFPFKNKIINNYSIFAVKYLNKSSSGKVVIGKEGWLFFRPEALLKNNPDPVFNGENTIDDFCGKAELNGEQLARIEAYLSSTAKMLQSRNIPFIIMIAPNKETVYSEYIPERLMFRGTGKRRIDQLIEICHGIKWLHTIDLRNILFEQKKFRQLYIKSDTHWNYFGAYLAYSELMDYLNNYNSSIKKLTPECFKYETRPFLDTEGDLSRILNTPELFENTIISFTPLKEKLPSEIEQKIQSFNIIHKRKMDVIKVTNPDNKLNLLLLDDSFGLFFNYYLPYSFNKTWIAWNYKTDENMIRQLKPDIVVLEIAERFIYLLGLI